nr:hypothetical protein [uncultured Anaerosporobacter sp.]
MKMSINIYSVELGSSENHLEFMAHVPKCSASKEYTFDYTGTELTTTATMTNTQLERLRKELKKDYGHAPFNEDKAKAILDGWKQYSITQ